MKNSEIIIKLPVFLGEWLDSSKIWKIGFGKWHYGTDYFYTNKKFVIYI